MVWVKNCLAYLSVHLRGWILWRKHICLEAVSTAVVSKVNQIIAMLYMKITLVYNWVIIADFSLVVPVEEVRIIKYSLMSWLVKGWNAANAVWKFWNLLRILKSDWQDFCNSDVVREVTGVFCSLLVQSVLITAHHVDHLLHLKWRLALTFLLNLGSPLILNLWCRIVAIKLV